MVEYEQEKMVTYKTEASDKAFVIKDRYSKEYYAGTDTWCTGTWDTSLRKAKLYDSWAAASLILKDYPTRSLVIMSIVLYEEDYNVCKEI